MPIVDVIHVGSPQSCDGVIWVRQHTYLHSIANRTSTLLRLVNRISEYHEWNRKWQRKVQHSVSGWIAEYHIELKNIHFWFMLKEYQIVLKSYKMECNEKISFFHFQFLLRKIKTLIFKKFLFVNSVFTSTSKINNWK